MAKGNLFLGTAAGKVGDVVMYRYEGKQCSRVRVREIKNPKSEAQQAQRAILSTVTNAYSLLSSICNHSFENVQYDGKSMNYFNKINLKTIRNLVSQSQNTQAYSVDEINGFADSETPLVFLNAPSTTAFIPNNYRISKGSLASKISIETDHMEGQVGPTLKFTIPNEPTSATIYDFLVANGLNDPRSLITCLYTTTNGQSLYATTDSEGRCRTIYNQELNIWRIFRNDFDIDALYSLSESDAISAYDEAGGFLWNWLHYTISEYAEQNPWDTNSEEGSAIFNLIFDTNVTSQDMFNQFMNMFAIDYNRMSIIYGQSVEDGSDTSKIKYVTGAAVIRSLYENEKWKRSNENFYLYAYTDTDYIGLAPNIGLNAWYNGTQSIGDSDYTLDGSTSE